MSLNRGWIIIVAVCCLVAIIVPNFSATLNPESTEEPGVSTETETPTATPTNPPTMTEAAPIEIILPTATMMLPSSTPLPTLTATPVIEQTVEVTPVTEVATEATIIPTQPTETPTVLSPEVTPEVTPETTQEPAPTLTATLAGEATAEVTEPVEIVATETPVITPTDGTATVTPEVTETELTPTPTLDLTATVTEIPATSTETPNVWVVVGQQSLLAGETTSVQVLIDCTVGSCDGVEIVLGYDPALVQVLNVRAGEYLLRTENALSPADVVIDAVQHTISAAFHKINEGAQPTNGSGVLLEIDVMGFGAGISSLDVQQVIILDLLGNPVDATGSAGAVVVLEAPTLTPTLTATPEPSPTMTATPTEVCLPLDVTSLDLEQMRQTYGTLGTAPDFREDVNGDGTVNILDLALVANGHLCSPN